MSGAVATAPEWRFGEAEFASKWEALVRKILLTPAIAVGMAVAGVPVISAVFGPDAAYAGGNGNGGNGGNGGRGGRGGRGGDAYGGFGGGVGVGGNGGGANGGYVGNHNG